MHDLNITLIQASLSWEDAEGNRQLFDRLWKQVPAQTDLIVLPEMFSTGFSMNAPALAEAANGASVHWMQEKARASNAVVCGSLIIREEAKYFNRLYWIQPDGSYETYDKRHLFRMAGEDRHYAPGMERKVMTCKDWRICPLICYDLRFPVWSRNRAFNGESDKTPAYDLLIYIANWPEKRSFAWKTLLAARAIENQAFVAGLNRIGEDGNGIAYAGDSVVLDPQGRSLTAMVAHRESVTTVALHAAALAEIRNQFPVGLDSDDFAVRL